MTFTHAFVETSGHFVPQLIDQVLIDLAFDLRKELAFFFFDVVHHEFFERREFRGERFVGDARGDEPIQSKVHDGVFFQRFADACGRAEVFECGRVKQLFFDGRMSSKHIGELDA